LLIACPLSEAYDRHAFRVRRAPTVVIRYSSRQYVISAATHPSPLVGVKIEGMPFQKCIYCLEEKESSAFNREHILPEAFGTFRDSLLRLECVCRSCNQYFGDHVELIFHRGSLEAMHRFLNGMKPPQRVGELRRDRLSITVGAPGDWFGVRLEFQDEEDNLVVMPVPQVGFARKGQQHWIYLTEAELADPQTRLPDDLDDEAGMKIFAPSEAVQERLITLLAARGIPFQQRRELSPPPAEGRQVLVDHHFSIDLITRRSVAKIAFNYMACVVGPDFALRPDFDVVRSFIRRGVLPDYPIVQASFTPILADDLQMQRQTNGHLLTLGWPGSQDQIVGQVSLFNLIRYTVLLTRKCSGIWQDIRQGHHFDISKGCVKPLLGSSLIVPRFIHKGLASAAFLAKPSMTVRLK
jgi:hypothetical protein